jgi:methionyl-tRNA formyltransferase
VLLVGLGATAASALEGLLERFEVVALVRGDDDDVVAAARDRGVLVSPDVTVRGLDRIVGRTRPDCVVVSSYDRILPDWLLRRCPFINIHYASLPRYRGRATVNWAIINGDSETAITIHCMVPELDAGGILYQETVVIGPTDTVTDLYSRLNAILRREIAAAVTRRLTGDSGEPQCEADASYACTRVPDDGEIDWSAPTADIDRLVRGLADPYPGAYTFLEGEMIWVRRSRPVADPPAYVGRINGRVVRVCSAEGAAYVLTGDGVLQLLEVQRHGGPVVPANQVICSVRQTLGVRAADLMRRVADLEREMAALRASQTYCSPENPSDQIATGEPVRSRAHLASGPAPTRRS